MTVVRVLAKVTAVFDRKTGEGQYGPWSLQNGTIEDETGKMKVVFKQLPSQDSLVGKTMIFKSMEGKHGLKGCEVKKNEYNGKTTLELHVSKAVLIVTSGEEDNVSLVTPSTRMPQNEPVEAPQAPIRHEALKLGIATAKNRLTQLAGLYDLCWKTVMAMEFKKDLEEQVEGADAEMLKDVATTLFIQATREGLSDKMPVRTLSKFYNEEEVKPASAKHRGEPEDFDADKESGNDLENDLHESDQPF